MTLVGRARSQGFEWRQVDLFIEPEGGVAGDDAGDEVELDLRTELFGGLELGTEHLGSPLGGRSQ